MARGWESKAIESQQADAGRSADPRPPLTSAERDRLAQRSSLELALAATQAELQTACRAAHRDMLRLRLEAIQAQLSALDEPAAEPR